jgi:hypothetical protein
MAVQTEGSGCAAEKTAFFDELELDLEKAIPLYGESSGGSFTLHEVERSPRFCKLEQALFSCFQ